VIRVYVPAFVYSRWWWLEAHACRANDWIDYDALEARDRQDASDYSNRMLWQASARRTLSPPVWHRGELIAPPWAIVTAKTPARRAARTTEPLTQQLVTAWEPICALDCSELHRASSAGPHLCGLSLAWCELTHGEAAAANRRASDRPYTCGCSGGHRDGDHKQGAPLLYLNYPHQSCPLPTALPWVTWPLRALDPVGPLRVERAHITDEPCYNEAGEISARVYFPQTVRVASEPAGLFPVAWSRARGGLRTWGEWVQAWKRASQWHEKTGTSHEHRMIRRTRRYDPLQEVRRGVFAAWRWERQRLAIDCGLVQFEHRLAPHASGQFLRRVRRLARPWAKPWNAARWSIARVRDARDVLAATWPLVRLRVRPVIERRGIDEFDTRFAARCAA
jgi:hypothetical protein